MPERLKLLFESGAFPFILAAGNNVKMNWTRVIETLVIAGLTAFGAMYSTQKVMEAEMGHLNGEVKEIKIDVKKIGREQSRRTPMIDYIEKQLSK